MNYDVGSSTEGWKNTFIIIKTPLLSLFENTIIKIR